MASTMPYMVRYWHYPRRMRGGWPVGYVSASIDASSPKEAAAKMLGMNHWLGTRAALEVKSYYDEVTHFLVSESGGLQKSRAKKRSYRKRAHSYGGR